MRAVSTLIATGAALWVAAMPAHAVGFGRVVNATQLGQPLDFVAAVRLDADEQLPPECISAEVQSGENRLGPGQVRVSLEGPADSNNRSVRVTTGALIDEPVVTVSVTLGCTAKVTRRFVAFVDPPLINAPQTAPAEAPPSPRADAPAAPATAPVATPVPRADASTGSRRPERTGAARPSARAPAPRTRPVASAREAITPQAAKPRRSPPSTRQSAVARAAPPGPRLQLETAAPIAARSASAPAPAAAPPAAVEAAAKPDPVADQLAVERQRIQVLEEGLAKLTKSSQANQASLTALQARLQEAESARYANPLVYVLAALLALLALAVIWLGWRQSRARGSAQWWAGPAPEPPASLTPLAAGAAAAIAAAELEEARAPAPAAVPPLAADAFAVSSVVEDGVPTVPAPEPVRELSVEELIDLEQQAEFFIVLGQDEAAIELLMSHVRTDGSNSPLPYLKLLEIYRRRGEREAYQRVRERFNRRFNAYAPDWESDPQQGRSLADYPDTMVRLQHLWSAPTRMMETLDASLFRRNRTDETFDLPAYRELLFLYSIARDLAEHGGTLPSTDVDLLLPLEGAGEEPISRLSATPPSAELTNGGLRTTRLNFDLTPDPATQNAKTLPLSYADRPASDAPHLIDFNLDAPPEPPKSGTSGTYH